MAGVIQGSRYVQYSFSLKCLGHKTLHSAKLPNTTNGSGNLCSRWMYLNTLTKRISYVPYRDDCG